MVSFASQKSHCKEVHRTGFEGYRRKLGRVVDCTGLENRQPERVPGFESLSFRHESIKNAPFGAFFLPKTLFFNGRLAGTQRISPAIRRFIEPDLLQMQMVAIGIPINRIENPESQLRKVFRRRHTIKQHGFVIR